MRVLLFILLLASLTTNAQFGNRNFFGASAVSPRPEGFDWNALTPQAPTTYNGSTIVVENKSFTNLNVGVNNGDDVYVTGNVNITFKNCYFGTSIRKGISIENATGTIRIENCVFNANEAAVHVVTSTVVFQMENSQCVNPWGAPLCKGQFFQAASATMTNSYIRDCSMKSFRGLGSTEDWISFFNSGGTSSSRFMVEGNLLQGGGPSISGGGIMLGDHGGSYVTVQNNKLNDPGNYQIAASGGNNFIVQNNLAYSTNTGYSRIAMYAYGQQGFTCGSITWQSNGTFIYNNNYWYPGDGSPAEDCGTITGANPTFTQTNLTGISFAQLGFPSTEIINFVTPKILYTVLLEESMQWRTVNGSCSDPTDLPDLSTIPIPTPNAGPDQAIGGTSTTLNASASTSSNGLNYFWQQVGGPVNTVIASPFAAITGVSGLSVAGVYEYLVIVTDNSGAQRGRVVTITKS